MSHIMPMIAHGATQADDRFMIRAAGEVAPAKVRARSNNFDAIRLVAALLVLCSHQLFFLGIDNPTIAGFTLGELAVMTFFVISGYLVADSWYRDPHLVRFLGRRFLRIWPALALNRHLRRWFPDGDA